ncbi:MAG: D-alanyl-D-alanine carboxypeptidase/D-alanyl-D-alanine-endopeptidase [Propionibacteriaceae bacterium]|nr:D-alanyl-D-alanine carboxypeptidase/D-alanyl-D-alanine-endopeptidase [Propionibacteriaceae bacterium]
MKRSSVALKLLTLLCVFSLSACAVLPPGLGSTPTPTVSPAEITPSPTPHVPAPIPTRPPVAALPDPEKLENELAKISSDSMTTAVVVLDSTGSVLYSNGDKPLIPASTLKILISMAVLDTLGSETTFQTTVVQESAKKIILVGGGDPLITSNKSKSLATPANMDQLVSQTVKSLQADGVKAVDLGYDDSLFSGPTWSESWDNKWKPNTPRISALMVDSGAVSYYVAAPDAAKHAAETFAKKLRAAGIKVNKIAAAKKPASAKEIASVSSASLSRIISYLTMYSHNVAAEVLLRHLALAVGEEPSFAGGSKALTTWLKDNELWSTGMVIDGGSGLSSKAKISAEVLAKAVLRARAEAQYFPLIEGMPFAGKTGTLTTRFNDKAGKPGIGRVFAKTGTLKNVASLAGWVTTADGATLTFAAMANNTGGAGSRAYGWLDKTAATIAKCGC